MYHTFKTTYMLTFKNHFNQACWSSPHPISSSQLHTLPYFHPCPINLVVFKGVYSFRMGYLILRGASRLDAFSVYPFRTWLLYGVVYQCDIYDRGKLYNRKKRRRFSMSRRPRGDKVSEVVASKKLVSHPVCLTAKGGIS